MDNGGWIKLFRKFKDWEWYQDANVSRLFIHLLLSVNFEEKKWQGFDVKKGQIIIGIEEFGLQIGLTRQQTRSALNKLKSTSEITIKTTNKFTVVTINKFNEYQEITSKPTNEQPTNNQQITTTKEYKEIKNEKKEIQKISKYPTIESIGEEEIKSLSEKYRVTTPFVRSKIDDMSNWHDKNPRKNHYINYFAALGDWVKRDSLKFMEKKYERASKIAIVKTDDN